MGNVTTAESYAHVLTAGDYAHAATTGYYANAATAGFNAHATTTGGGDRAVPEDTEVEVILRNGNRLSQSAGSLDWDIDHHPRDIIAYRVITDARAIEARELRAWFTENAPTKFKQGDMVLYCGQLRMVAGVLPYNKLNKYCVVRNGDTDIVGEEELTRYEEGK